MAIVYEFNYTGAEQSVVLPPGKYKFECFGACGGNYYDFVQCAKGGYTAGSLILKENTTLHVYVGQSGYYKGVNGIETCRSGFNGAGGINTYKSTSDGYYSLAGGGATDIRLIGGNWDNLQSLLSRIIVAGGGGGGSGNSHDSIGHGGGTKGKDGISIANKYFAGGGSQFQGGLTFNSLYNGSFGVSGAGDGISGVGGGGGWYCGAGSFYAEFGGGGSGYILTKDSYKPANYSPSSKYYFSDINSVVGGNTTKQDGYAKITLLQALPFLTISSYNSTTATFKADHTDPTLLTKIEYFIDDVLKETITTDLTTEKIINYTLEDNALHTLKIVVTDSANATAEKVVSISKGIAPLPAGSTTDEVTNKWIEIKDTFKSGKTSIINTLALKNIEASLNNTLVELSEKIKTSFDSSDASVEELQNRITELTNQLSQRIKYATGTYTPPDGSQNSLIVPTKLNFVPKTIIISYISFRDTSQPFKYLHAYPCMSGRDRNLKYDNGSYTRIVGTANVRDITADSFNIEIGISDLSAGIKFPISFYTSTFRWYALDIELLNN
ncbi:TPA: glycine rich domain-containing protein [Clostridioides difficile]|nr:hypothetical protein [Clostridioides difficile]